MPGCNRRRIVNIASAHGRVASPFKSAYECHGFRQAHHRVLPRDERHLRQAQGTSG